MPTYINPRAVPAGQALATDAELAASEAAAALTYESRFGSGHGRGVVCFTWDDGWASQVTIAAAAEARGQRHTFLPHTDALGTTNRLTNAQLVALSDAGHEIGTHGKTHTDLTGLSAANRLIEYQAQDTIEALIGDGKCRTLAYPYGQKTATIEQEVALRFDRTVIVGNLSTPWRQPRNGLRSHSINRLNWTSDNHVHVLAAIRQAAITNTVTFILSHGTTDAGDITPTELIEALDLAEELGVLCTTMADAAPVSNQLINPGFEDDLAGWYVNDAGAVVTVADTPDTNLGGTRSLQLTLAGAGDVEAQQVVPVVIPGEQWTISGRYRSSQSTDYARVQVTYLDASNTTISSQTQNNAVPAASWTRFAKDLTVPAGTASMRVYCYITTAGVAYFDHLWLAPTHHGSYG